MPYIYSGKQTTNLITIGDPFINIQYENDMPQTGLFKNIPLVPKGDGDRYRTAAVQINWGPFGIGTNMMTGQGDETKTLSGHDTYVPNDEYNPDSHRLGVFYFKFGSIKIGKNSESIRNALQNQLIHSRVGSPYFSILPLKSRMYFHFGGSAGGSLW